MCKCASHELHREIANSNFVIKTNFYTNVVSTQQNLCICGESNFPKAIGVNFSVLSMCAHCSYTFFSLFLSLSLALPLSLCLIYTIDSCTIVEWIHRRCSSMPSTSLLPAFQASEFVIDIAATHIQFSVSQSFMRL